MPSKNTTTVVLTEPAQVVKIDLAPVFGLKNILSAGLLLFGRLSSDEQKRLIAEANGIQSDDPAELAASAARMCIKTYQALSTKDFSVSLQFLSDQESRAVREMLNALSAPPPRKPLARKRRIGKREGA